MHTRWLVPGIAVAAGVALALVVVLAVQQGGDDEARAELEGVVGFESVIRAAESADIAALLDLAETTIFRCADAGRTAPSECADQPDAKLPVVTHWVGAGRPTPRPVTWMDRRLHELFDDNAPVLVFAARELAPPDEGGGRYFLVFVAPELRDPESRYDRIGLIVRPHPDHPIEAIAFGVPGSSPVAWGASIAPQSEVVLATVPVGP